MIKLTFLGTSDAIPTASRNHSAVFLQYNGEGILVDCGEGTQRQFKKAGISPTKITRILITHWHGDHVLGIPGLIQSLSLMDYSKTLYIYGPKGTKKFFKKILETFAFTGKKYSIKTEEVSGRFLETKDFYIEAESMVHKTPCNAYCFVKKSQLKIDKRKLKKFKIPSIPLLKNLKQGKSITYNGKTYSAKQLTFIQEPVKISFVFDTKNNKKIIPFVKNSDVIVSEATFLNELKATAEEYFHLTARQAGEIAKKSKSKKLILTHVSQRYEKNMKSVLKEAKSVFNNSFLAEDLDVFEVE